MFDTVIRKFKTFLLSWKWGLRVQTWWINEIKLWIVPKQKCAIIFSDTVTINFYLAVFKSRCEGDDVIISTIRQAMTSSGLFPYSWFRSIVKLKYFNLRGVNGHFCVGTPPYYNFLFKKRPTTKNVHKQERIFTFIDSSAFKPFNNPFWHC